MGKNLYIAEKPSVAKEFAKALHENLKSSDGYLESEQSVVTWCVGHLVTMSYPDAYDPKYKKWSLETIPFIPDDYRYEVIDSVRKQYNIVKGLLNRPDVSTIYVCTDSGREGEYIYRLVAAQAGVTGKSQKRVWIDSQTEDEIHRGIQEAKDESAYDDLAASAYLRAQEDYLMGINFSRALTLKYGYPIKNYLKKDKAVVAVGRVMTCVLGIVVKREREIRDFVKTPYYKIIASFDVQGHNMDGEWKVTEKSAYSGSPKLYRENGFREKKDADALIGALAGQRSAVASVSKKKEVKNPPLLYNLAELQNDCSRYFKISPSETLDIAQSLYEKKLTTYPRTDARVLSTAVSKEIDRNLTGISSYAEGGGIAKWILSKGTYKDIAKTKYVNDKQITDHYAIIPTGQGLSALGSLKPAEAKTYELIVRRFLGIFLPPAVYQKVAVTVETENTDTSSVSTYAESFFSSFKVLSDPGYLRAMQYSFFKNKLENTRQDADADSDKDESQEQDEICDTSFMEILGKIKKGTELKCSGMKTKDAETAPPKRYNSGSMILTMENAGQFIEDDDLRAQIKGSGIGTSATRAEILKKLFKNQYLNLNKKTQIITPTMYGEIIYEVVGASIKSLLDPKLTASWEKGLTLVAEGDIKPSEYTSKMNEFVTKHTEGVKSSRITQNMLYGRFEYVSRFYKK
jgi:DNA topoisomerase-3